MNCINKNAPRILKISKIVNEGLGQKSIFFNETIDSKPGQFIMVYLPGVDEKPMAISYKTRKEFAFTSQAVGKFTKAIEKLKPGDKLGIRGPYGKGFSLKKNACVIAGGVGMSSVSTLIDKLKNPLIIYGARSKNHLIYLKRYKKNNLEIATDDGSSGFKGFNTVLLEKALKEKKIKQVYTCGPEVMMEKVFNICKKNKVECEASLERYMSCGFGVCGKCMVDDQIVCVDGPVFTSKQLLKMPEFGNSARLKSGRKVSLQEYHATPT